MEKINLWINAPKRYMIYITCSFMLGILLYLTKLEYFFYTYIFLFLCSLIVLIFMFVKKLRGKKSSGYIHMSAVISIFMLLGMLRIAGFDDSFSERVEKLPSEKVLYTGIAISETVTVNETFKSVLVHVLDYEIKDDKKELFENIRVYYQKEGIDEIYPGDYVEFYGKVSETDEEYIIKQKSENITATVFSSACFSLKETGHVVRKITFGERLKISIKMAIQKLYSHNINHSAIMTGVLTGDTENFSENLYNGFADGGFAHTVAVSGLHVSLLYLFLASALGRLGINRTTISFVGIIIVFAFCGVAGYTASSMRAAIMIGIRISAFYLKREYDILSSLFLAAFLILIYNPYKMFTAGFLLSFGATFGIAIYYNLFEGIKNKVKIFTYIPGIITDSINLSLSAFLGTLPFCLYFFENINITSVITNIWIVPAVTVIFVLGALSYVFYYIFPWLSFNIIRYLCEPFLLVVSKTAEFFENHNPGVFEYSYIPSGAYAFIVSFCISVYLLLKYINIRLEK